MTPSSRYATLRRIMKIFAHRGAPREAPENTLLAFKTALELGVDGIECDILLTKDKIPVVTHNDDLSILTNQKGHIHDLPFSSISHLDLGKGQTIPTLTEVLELAKPYPNCKMLLELKHQPGLARDTTLLVGGLAAELLPPEQFIFSSFSLPYLHWMKKQHPKFSRAWIVARPLFTLVPFSVFDTLLPIQALHLRLDIISSPLVEKARREGWEVATWVVNHREQLQKAQACGVDGIFTDDPRWAQQALRGSNHGG